MKKRIISLLLIAVMCLPLPISAEEAADAADNAEKIAFSDVPQEHEAYEAVMFLAGQGIINGKSETIFAPGDNLKREEFAKILTNAFGLTNLERAPVFNDVLARTWYADFVAKVASSGLMQGISDSEFGVGYNLSRQDLAVILKRFLEKENVVLSSDSSVIYADSSEIAPYAQEAAQLLGACGIIPGKDNNLWKPTENATRADAALAVYNALMYKKEYISSLGRMGAISQYDPPYDVPNDRLAEATPMVFDANLWPKRELVYEDFEDGDYGELVPTGFSGSNISFDYENGYNSKGCLKIDGNASAATYPSFRWTCQPGELKAGDFLVFTLRIKAENVSGDGLFCGKVAVYDDNGKWLAESWGDNQKTNMDWTEFQWIQMVTEELNDLTPPQFYTAGLGAYVKNMGGTFYFDDFKLSVVNFDPMDTVLMTPNYKGIIKGEGGVGDISLRAYVSDGNGAYDLNSFKLTAQITDEEHNVLLKSESETVTSAMDVYFSSATLPMGGDFYLESILTDKNTGEEIQKSEWPLHKREADFETRIGYDEYGRVLIDGEPDFPLSMYNSSSYDDAVPDFVNAGSIDNMMHSGMGWYYNWGTNEKYRNLINTLGENDMNISLAFGTLVMETTTKEITSRVKTQADLRGLTTRIVENFKDLPHLFGYYIYDEMNAMRYGEQTAWARKIIESVDLEHPTLCAIDNPISYRPGVYAKTSDFLGLDPYPVTGKPDQDISLVYDRISESKALNPNRPVYCIMQGFWYNTRGDLRSPNKEEFRNMAFQAITAGACMLDMYSYRWLKSTPCPEKGFEEDWANYTSVYKEIQYLKPIILSVLPAPHYEVKGGGEWLNTMSRRYDGKSYLFAVNNENEGKTVLIHLDGADEIRGMYSGNTYEANSDGWFEIDMEAYEVDVFEYEQADYKSSHAQLTRFGLADCITTDSEGEPCIVVSNGKSELEYNAAISDYATFYINGTEMPPSGTIDISALTELNVKVVSEDGRFKTEKTYKLELKR